MGIIGHIPNENEGFVRHIWHVQVNGENVTDIDPLCLCAAEEWETSSRSLDSPDMSLPVCSECEARAIFFQIKDDRLDEPAFTESLDELFLLHAKRRLEEEKPDAED